MEGNFRGEVSAEVLKESLGAAGCGADVAKCSEVRSPVEP
jgi:hypothetical protein